MSALPPWPMVASSVLLLLLVQLAEEMGWQLLLLHLLKLMLLLQAALQETLPRPQCRGVSAAAGINIGTPGSS